MNLPTQNKRKSPIDQDQNVGVRASKILKDTGQLLDQVSSNNVDLAEAEEEIVVEKEIIRKKYNDIKQEKQEPISSYTEPPETSNLNPSEEVDDSLINNLLISDDEDDEISDDDSTENIPSKTMTEKFSAYLKAESMNSIESLRQKTVEVINSKNKIIENLKQQNSQLRTDYEARLKVKKEVLDEDLENNKKDFYNLPKITFK